MKRLLAAVLASSICLLSATTVMGGLVERHVALDRLADVEVIVYLGSSGSVGIGGALHAAHPSMLSRVLDAKSKNDNALIGSSDALIEGIAMLRQGIDGLVASDDDYALVDAESEAMTGFTFTERLEILREKLLVTRAEVPDSGINKATRKQVVVERMKVAIARIEEMIDRFRSQTAA